MSETCTVGETTVVDGVRYLCAETNTWYIKAHIDNAKPDVWQTVNEGLFLASVILLVISITSIIVRFIKGRIAA